MWLKLLSVFFLHFLLAASQTPLSDINQLTNAPSNSIFLLDGTYSISSTFAINNAITLLSNTSAVVKCTSKSPQIYIEAHSSLTVIGISFQNCLTCMRLKGTNNNSIINSSFIDHDYGVQVYAYSNLLIEGSTFDKITVYGIHMVFGDITVRQSRFFNCGIGQLRGSKGHYFNTTFSNSDVFLTDKETEAHFENCNFTDVRVGPINAYNSKLTIENCFFSNNGGPSVVNSQLKDGTLNIINSVFSNNTSSLGVILVTTSTIINLIGSIFSNNSGTSFIARESSFVLVQDTIFSGNTGILCGGLCLHRGELVANNSVFENNIGQRAGGIGLFNLKSSLIYNCTISNNYAYETDSITGGGIVSQNSQLEVHQSTFFKNKAHGMSGSNILVNSSFLTLISNSTIIESIESFSESSIHLVTSDHFIIRNSTLQLTSNLVFCCTRDTITTDPNHLVCNFPVCTHCVESNGCSCPLSLLAVSPPSLNTTCTCAKGFVIGGEYQCTDINECMETHSCDYNANCTNTIGSYNCTCYPGYQGNGTFCEDINECDDPSSCYPNAACSDFEGGFNCTCPFGYSGSGVGALGCFAICTNTTCSNLVNCTNDVRGFMCGACPYGFIGNGYGENGCKDFDECYDNHNNSCSDFSNCTNLYGTYNCTCFDGFYGNGLNCTDVNECYEIPYPCFEGVSCSNTNGSFECGECPPGFEGDGLVDSCFDINECNGLNNCFPGTCNNTVGNYTCGSCPAGFDGDGYNCNDINECNLNSTFCPEGTLCTNGYGNYSCEISCPIGYYINGSQCEDTDECEGSNLCFPGTCINNIGNYTCGSCPQGYKQGLHDCTDIDECHGINECYPGTCLNGEGNYTCGPCPTGYERLGLYNCTDINECDLNLNMCYSGTCINTEGNYTCADCPYGYERHGLFNCTLVQSSVQDVANKKSLNIGPIIGGVLGGLVLIAVLALVAYYRKKKHSRDYDFDHTITGGSGNVKFGIAALGSGYSVRNLKEQEDLYNL